MKEGIFTLPLTPRENPSLFFYLTPFIADVWGKIERKPVYILVNLQGMKYSPTALQSFTQHIEKLEIKRKMIYDLEYSLDRLQTDCDQLLKEGVLNFGLDEILICECGRVECLSEALPMKSFRVIDSFSSSLKCKFCQQSLRVKKTEVLKWHVADCSIPECIWYDSALKEIKDKSKEISNRAYLVSRTKHSCPEISLGRKSVKIDVDFFWKLFMVNLIKKLEFVTIDLPVTSTVYPQMLLFYSLAKQIKPDIEIKVYSVPKVFFKNQTFANEEIWCLDPLTLRLLLSFGIGRTRKEFFLESKIVHWTKITVENIPLHPNGLSSQLEFVNFKDLCLTLKKYPLAQILKTIRSCSLDLFSTQIITAIF